MKITDSRTGKVAFGNISNGDAFMLNEHVCMKVSEVSTSSDVLNAFDFAGNTLFRVDTAFEVDPVNAEVVIKD